MNRHATLQKKVFVRVISCPHLKFSLQGGFIVGLKKFYHYLLEIEAEENFCQKSSTARALCNKNKKMLCFLAINKINRAITTL